MSNYVIRGGAAGKARLSVISQALASSTAALLDAAGVREGMRCLDLGCGGGDVTLALARLVGPSGGVVGIDMDVVKIELAQQDARDEAVGHVEYRSVMPRPSTLRGEYDAVYARLLLTHLAEPEADVAAHDRRGEARRGRDRGGSRSLGAVRVPGLSGGRSLRRALQRGRPPTRRRSGDRSEIVRDAAPSRVSTTCDSG